MYTYSSHTEIERCLIYATFHTVIKCADVKLFKYVAISSSSDLAKGLMVPLIMVE